MPSLRLAPALKRALAVEAGAPGRHGSAAVRHGPVVVLGVGSDLRRDDAAGPRVARALIASPIAGVHAIDGGPAPENHTAEIKRLSPSLLLIVDCALLGEEPGSVWIIEPSEVESAGFGTHGLPLTVVADYLRAETGCGVLFVGIQPLSVDDGEGLSREAEAGVAETVAALRECLGRHA
jgi:hydrogenase 3 maturation protease